MNKKRTSLIFISSLVLIFLFISSIYNFTLDNQQLFIEKTSRSQSELSEQYNSAFVSKLTAGQQLLETIALTLKAEDAYDVDFVLTLLKAASKNSDFTNTFVASSTGYAISQDNKRLTCFGTSYLNSALNGKKYISDPVISVLSGQPCIIMSVPIYSSTRDEVEGAVFGSFYLSSMENLRLYHSDNPNEYGVICDNFGNVILKTENTTELSVGDNVFDLYSPEKISGGRTQAEIKQSVFVGETISSKITLNGEMRYITFSHTGINNWFTVFSTTDAVVKGEIREINKIVIVLIGQLLIVAILGLSVVYYIRRENKKELKRVNEKYANLLQNIQGAVTYLKFDPVTYALTPTFVSEGWKRLTGYSPEDFVNNAISLESVIHPQDTDNALSTFYTHIKLQQPWEQSYRIITKSGDTIWVSDRGVTFNEDGGVFIQSIITDITASKNTESEMEFVNQKFESLISNIQGGVITIKMNNATGAVTPTYISEGWQNLTGYTAFEIKTLFNGDPRGLILEEDAHRVKNEFAVQCALESTYKIEYRTMRKDGTIVWVLDKGVLLPSDEGFTVNQSIIVDITSSKSEGVNKNFNEKAFRDIFTCIGKTISDVVIQADITNDRIINDGNGPFEFLKSHVSYTACLEAALGDVHPDYVDKCKSLFSTDGLIAHYNQGQTQVSCVLKEKFETEDYRWAKIESFIYHSWECDSIRVASFIKYLSDDEISKYPPQG